MKFDFQSLLSLEASTKEEDFQKLQALAQTSGVTIAESNIYSGFKESELRAAFDKVKEPTNWKLPIDAVITKVEVAVVKAAISFYAGGEASFTFLDNTSTVNGLVRVRAPGYWGTQA